MCCSHITPCFASLTVLDHVIGIRLEALEMCYILGALSVLSEIGGERITRTYLKN